MHTGRTRRTAQTTVAKRSSVLIVVPLLLASIVSLPALFHPVNATASAPSFTFTAAGDYGGIIPPPLSTHGSRGYNLTSVIASKYPNFSIALGDLGYTSQNPSNWCGNFTSLYPATGTGALVLVTGNHDTNNTKGVTVYYQASGAPTGSGGSGAPSDVLTNETTSDPVNGFWDTYSSSGNGYASECGAPSGIGWVGSQTSSNGLSCNNVLTAPTCYGREYYFDYPSSNPIMRFIIVSAGICGKWFNGCPGSSYAGWKATSTCPASGSEHYCWLKARIDEAKNAGLWVAVAVHKQCLNDDATSSTSCPPSLDAFNLAIKDKVDLWLDGHVHNYERSKQLTSCTPSTGFTISSCIYNTGTNVSGTVNFARGSGMIVNIIGTGGIGNLGICTTCSNAQYFQKLCGSNMDIGIPQTGGCKNDYGFVQFTVTTSSISARWVDVQCSSSPCTLSDSYSINVPAPPGDFSMYQNPSTVRLFCSIYDCTTSTTSILSLTSFGSFSGPVSLSYVKLNTTNISVTGLSSATLGPNGITTLTITASGKDNGLFLWNITSTYGVITHWELFRVSAYHCTHSPCPVTPTG